MTASELRTTHAWHEALDLGQHLVRVAENLPESEHAGLGAIMRGLAVDISASTATDLLANATAATTRDAFRAVAVLEVVEQVYPALDTAAARAAAEVVVDRVTGSGFADTAGGSVAPAEIIEAVAAAAPGVSPAGPAVDSLARPMASPQAISVPGISAPQASTAPPDWVTPPVPAAGPQAVTITDQPAPASIPVSLEAPHVPTDRPQ